MHRIDQITVVYFVTKPLNRSEAECDLESPRAALQVKGSATN